ncbi:hypothetical protein JCM10207_004923 [Rhodosporidiobolus poonsookiae]
MQPLVSTRISLRWPPAPAAEHEAVLVIQGRSGFFLDLRVRRLEADGQGTAPPDLREKGEYSVEWATAGWKTLLPPREGEAHPRARFEAILDSRNPPFSSSSSSAPSGSSPSSNPADPPSADEGSFEPLPNGDVLETGEMLNLDTGTVQPYEEVWRRLPFVHDHGAAVRIVVLERADETSRAYVGRVGDWEVGLVDSKEGFGAVRRERRSDGTWEEVYVNEAGRGLPSCVGEEKAVEGETVELDGQIWRVIESS